jgi:hypothetical protein
MSDSNDHDANSNNLPSGTEAAVIPLGSAKKGDVGNTDCGWTAKLDIALLEEVGNCCAHTPGQNQTTKCWENVLGAVKNCGIPFDNCVENFGDDDDDPFGQMMEDLLEEMNDVEVEKFQKH